jgi:hypothetical protein
MKSTEPQLTRPDLQTINRAAQQRMTAEFARIRNELVERAKVAIAAGRDWHEVL